MQKLLQSAGWALECESPFSIRHNDGSIATMRAAELVYQTLKTTQDKALDLLETVISKRNTKFIIETSQLNIITAVRALDTYYKKRTHNIKINTETGHLWWENSNSQEWGFQFESIEFARQWWDEHITPKVVGAAEPKL